MPRTKHRRQHKAFMVSQYGTGPKIGPPHKNSSIVSVAWLSWDSSCCAPGAVLGARPPWGLPEFYPCCGTCHSHSALIQTAASVKTRRVAAPTRAPAPRSGSGSAPRCSFRPDLPPAGEKAHFVLGARRFSPVLRHLPRRADPDGCLAQKEKCRGLLS